MYQEDPTRRRGDTERRTHAEARRHRGRGVNNNFFIPGFSYTEKYDVIRRYFILRLRVFAFLREVFLSELKQVKYDRCD